MLHFTVLALEVRVGYRQSQITLYPVAFRLSQGQFVVVEMDLHRESHDRQSNSFERSYLVSGLYTRPRDVLLPPSGWHKSKLKKYRED